MGKDVKRQERGRREGRKGCRVCALRGPLQRGMLALPHFCSPLQGVSVPRDQSSPHWAQDPCFTVGETELMTFPKWTPAEEFGSISCTRYPTM